tara:strand:- start:1138 stop:1485 length:348 start_codon:yes stop_codon:yes gene_type:complete
MSSCVDEQRNIYNNTVYTVMNKFDWKKHDLKFLFMKIVMNKFKDKGLSIPSQLILDYRKASIFNRFNLNKFDVKGFIDTYKYEKGFTEILKFIFNQYRCRNEKYHLQEEEETLEL